LFQKVNFKDVILQDNYVYEVFIECVWRISFQEALDESCIDADKQEKAQKELEESWKKKREEEDKKKKEEQKRKEEAAAKDKAQREEMDTFKKIVKKLAIANGKLGGFVEKKTVKSRDKAKLIREIKGLNKSIEVVTREICQLEKEKSCLIPRIAFNHI